MRRVTVGLHARAPGCAVALASALWLGWIPASPAGAATLNVESLDLGLIAPITRSLAADQSTQRYLNAERALKRGRRTEFRRLSAKLKSHPLYPYLLYEDLIGRLGSAKSEEIERFLEDHTDSPLSARLRRRWLEVLARRGWWNTYLKVYEPQQTNVKLRCHFLTAMLNSGQRPQALDQVRDIWLAGESRPSACDPVFKAWIDAGRLTRELTWERIGLAMERGKPGLASYLSRFLPKDERPLASQWIALRRSPHQIKKIAAIAGDPIREQMLVYAVKRTARRDPDRAAALWSYIAHRHVFPDPTAERVYRELGIAFARRGRPEAITWLGRIPAERRDDHARHWHFAVAALFNRWQEAVDGLTPPALSPENDQRWNYWRARGLEALGRQDEALMLYKDLASRRSYYGFLAADAVGVPYAFVDQPLVVDEGSLVSMAATPAAKRVRLLRALDRTLDARREWFYWIGGMNLAELGLAAKLAQRWGWHDAGILTVARTEHRDDLELRFPLAYVDEAGKQAAQHGLEAAMVLALIRQESAFMADATSPRGARGLMQLMPSTGRQVARSLGTPLKRRSQLYEPSVNLKLGTAYFRRMLDKHGAHPVLALGAYNAGPGSVNRWRARPGPVDADIWVENVTYRETREYIKRVLAYTTVYEYRLAREPTLLSARMGKIYPP